MTGRQRRWPETVSAKTPAPAGTRASPSRSGGRSASDACRGDRLRSCPENRAGRDCRRRWRTILRRSRESGRTRPQRLLATRTRLRRKAFSARKGTARRASGEGVFQPLPLLYWAFQALIWRRPKSRQSNPIKHVAGGATVSLPALGRSCRRGPAGLSLHRSAWSKDAGVPRTSAPGRWAPARNRAGSWRRNAVADAGRPALRLPATSTAAPRAAFYLMAVFVFMVYARFPEIMDLVTGSGPVRGCKTVACG